jgi:uncharacterized protein YgbK (DUF1537 family)
MPSHLLRRVDAASILATLPPPLVVPDALAQIASHLAQTGTRFVALDDDPTGTQTLQGVDIIAGLSPDDLQAVWEGAPGLSVVLTNTRSLSPQTAAALVRDLGQTLERESARRGLPLWLAVRGDSTLRGHMPLETDTLCDVASEHGRPYEAVLFTPAYLEARRITVGDVQWVGTDDGWVAAAETEYATDSTFGYRSSNLRGYLEEKSGGRWRAAEVTSVDLTTIRSGGPDAVAAVLAEVRGARPVVVNAASVHDLEVVALAVARLEADGRRILHRLGPSLLRVLAGREQRPPLSPGEIYPDGPREGHGLVVVGSHTANTTRQVERLTERAAVATVELDVPQLVAGTREAELEVARVTRLVIGGLGTGDVVLRTSRRRITGSDEASSLNLAAEVSTAVSAVVADVVRRRVPLRFVVAKGGITSHDVATRGLGLRRAVVAGQLFDGLVSVFRTVEADVAPGLPYVVFPGNVGGEDSLADAIALLTVPGPETAP